MKICFVGHGYDSLKGIPQGGAERNISLLAHSLSKRNHQVSFVATGEIIDSSHIDEISVFQAWTPKSGLKGIRFFTTYLPSLYRVLQNIDADVYYSKGYSLFAPVVIQAARSCNVISLLAIASDSDLLLLDPSTKTTSLIGTMKNGFAARYLFRKYALRRASIVAVQTHEQARKCFSLGIQCEILPNIVDSSIDYPVQHDEPKWDVVWIGHFSNRKGVRELLAIIKDLNEYSCLVVGKLVHEDLRSILEEICSLKNVTYFDVLSQQEVLEAIQLSQVVINTSPFEGFSNVFLESWLLNTPVISLNANPDSLLSDTDDFGYCAEGSLDNMLSKIRSILDNQDLFSCMGSKARNYVITKHSADAVCNVFEQLCYNHM